MQEDLVKRREILELWESKPQTSNLNPQSSRPQAQDPYFETTLR